MGGSGSGKQDDVLGPEEGRAAEVVALNLGELLEDLFEEVRRLPWWRPAPGRRRAIERSITVGLTFFYAWRDAFYDGAHGQPSEGGGHG
jgi:hypothetical protein